MTLTIINTTVSPDGAVRIDYHLDEPENFQHIVCSINGIIDCLKESSERGFFKVQCVTGQTSRIRLIAISQTMHDEVVKIEIDIPLGVTEKYVGKFGRVILTDEIADAAVTPSKIRHRKGFASIGLFNPKDPVNIGGVVRAVQAYGAASIAISGERIKGQHIDDVTNTGKGHVHIPVYRGDLRSLIPFAATPVAVELVDDAIPLMNFKHPRSAFYIFGPEDGSVPGHVLDWCVHKVQIPTAICLNLAMTVNTVLYDRMAKENR